MSNLQLTLAGAQVIEAAYQSGDVVVITEVGIGDAGGVAANQNPELTALVGEFGREPFSAGGVDDVMIGGEIVIESRKYPAKVIRELGLFSSENVLIAYGVYPDTYLPEQADNILKEVIIRFALALSHTECVTVVVDPTLSILTRDEGDARYLNESENLADVDDIDASRENLGCGTAATYNAQTSITDSTRGALMVNGAWGLGGTAPRTELAAGWNYDDIPTQLPSGFYTHQVTGGPFCYTFTLLQDGGGAGNNRHLIIPSNQTDKVAIRWDTGKTFSYQYFYTDKNKPTSADVGALPVAGGTMAGAIRVSGTGHGAFSSQNNGEAPLYQYVDTAQTSEYWPIIKQRYKQANSTWSAGMLINVNQFVVHHIDSAGKSTSFYFRNDGQFIPQSYANFDEKYQAKGNYTPAGQAYTKTESDARYLQGVQLGSAVSMEYYLEVKSVPAGCVITAMGASGGDNVGMLRYKPIQRNINGTWVTISG